MELLCIFPVGGMYEKNIPLIAENLEKEILPLLKKFGVNIQIKFPKDNYIYVENKKEKIPTPKGRGIKESLEGSNPYPDYVICCDGSGKIPYEKVNSVFQELISDPKIYCVMANRIGNKAIVEERYLIERFEIFSLKRLFNYEGDIPDGQCGLWGYKATPFFNNGKSKRINLTAEGYEVELDLLSEVLENLLDYSFIDVELPISQYGRIPSTSFNFESNLLKLKFLLFKYPNLKKNLLTYISEFEKSEESRSFLIKDGIKKYWGEYKLKVVEILGS